MYLYPAILAKPDENGDIVVSFPDVPENRAESGHYRRLIITGRMDLALHQIVKRRGISKAVARRLAEHFRVSVELFV